MGNLNRATTAVAVATARGTLNCLEAPMPMIDAMNHKRPFAAWGLAALLVSPMSVANDIVDIRAVAGLPRAGFSDGQAIAWRNVGIAAESDLLDAEVKVASCLPAATTQPTPSDLSGSACSASVGPFATGNLGHQLALTFKVPRWSEGAPLVNLALRSWRAPSRVGTTGERRNGSAAELVVTQRQGVVDTFIGFSMPVTLANAASHWRSAFAGVTWYAAQGTRLELVADRGEEATTAAIERTITLRFVHAVAGRNTRVSAWTTRALDDRTNAWQVGAGFDIAF